MMNDFQDGRVQRMPPRLEDDQRRTLVHPFSAFLLIMVDSLWMLAEWNMVTWVITIPLSFLSVGLATLLIELSLNRHTPFKAAAIAFFLGIVAAVPTSVLATPFGASLLAWAGYKRFIKRI